MLAAYIWKEARPSYIQYEDIFFHRVNPGVGREMDACGLYMEGGKGVLSYG